MLLIYFIRFYNWNWNKVPPQNLIGGTFKNTFQIKWDKRNGTAGISLCDFHVYYLKVVEKYERKKEMRNIIRRKWEMVYTFFLPKARRELVSFIINIANKRLIYELYTKQIEQCSLNAWKI